MPLMTFNQGRAINRRRDGLVSGVIYFSDFGVSLAAPSDPNYYRMALLADATGQANGTGYTTEESRHGATMTYNGSAAIASSKFEFNGTTDSITLPDSILWTPGSKFTIEVLGLVLDKANSAPGQGIICHYEADGGEISWHMQEIDGHIEFNWSTNGTGTTHSIVVGSVTSATEYNLAICWDGETVYSLLNGVQGGSTPFTGSFFNAPVVLRLGALADNGAAVDFLDGRFACAMITRGECLYAKTETHSVPSLPRAVSTPSLVDSEWPNVVALITYDDTISRIRDVGPLDLPISVIGNAAGSTSVEPFADANSIALDGTGDYLQIADNPFLEVGSGPLTIELFARHSVNTTLQTYVSKWAVTGNNRSFALQYRGADATDVVRYDIDADGAAGSSVSVPTAAYTPTTGQFDHVAYCRSGNDHRIFIEGTQSGSTVSNAVSAFNGTAPLLIGSQDGSGDMNGYLSEIRITKAARYTSNFTAPSAVFPRG